MQPRVKLELEAKIECVFSSFSLSFNVEDITQNSANFEIPVHNYNKNEMLRPDLKKGLKAKVYFNDELRLTGEIETIKRTITSSQVSIAITIKSKGAKSTKSTAVVKDGDMLDANLSDILKELCEKSGFEYKAGEFEDEKITRYCTTGFEPLDRELHILTRDRGIHLYETPEGELCATQKDYEEFGCDLVFGKDFETIESEESQSHSSDKIKTFGGRNISKDTDFEGSFTPSQEESSKLTKDGVYYIYGEGDQTPKSLKNKAAYEVNRRAAASNSVSITVPKLVSPNGEAWGFRKKHRIISSPHGIDDDMVLKKIELKGDKENVEANLEFSPVKGLTNKKGGESKGKSKINETLE